MCVSAGLPKLGDGKGGIGEYTAWKVDDLLISRKMMDFISGGDQIEGIPDEIYMEKLISPDLALKVRKTPEISNIFRVLMTLKFTREQIAEVFAHLINQTFEGTSNENSLLAARFRPFRLENKWDGKQTI